jgi:hypothetical protein
VLKVVIASRMDAMVKLQTHRIRERAEVRRWGHCKREIDEQRLRGEEGPTTIVDIRGQEKRYKSSMMTNGNIGHTRSVVADTKEMNGTRERAGSGTRVLSLGGGSKCVVAEVTLQYAQQSEIFTGKYMACEMPEMMMSMNEKG